MDEEGHNPTESMKEPLLRDGECPNERYDSLHTDPESDEDDAAALLCRDATLVAEEHQTTALQAVIHVLKGNIGPGCLSLPWAFSQLGFWWGSVACIVLCYWCTYCSWMTIIIKRHYPEQINTYPDVGTWAYGKKFGMFVRLCVCVQQTAICTVYLSFAGANLLAAWNSTSLSPSVQHIIVMTIALPVVMGLSCLASLKTMAPFSALGGLTLTTGLALIAVIVAQDWSMRPIPPPSFDWTNAPLAICGVLFSYEGISLVMPIETSMAKPEKFKAVFWGSKVIVCSTFILVAGTSIFAFGHVSNGSITAYLLASHNGSTSRYVLLTAANTVTGISVLLTYPLQMFPALQLIGPFIASKRTQPVEPDPESNGESSPEPVLDEQEGTGIPGDTPMLRISYVLVTYLVAVIVPNVQLLISLVGALAGSSTALLIPPVLEYEYRRRHGGSILSRARCLLVFALGMTFMLIGTSSALINIVKAYTGGRGF